MGAFIWHQWAQYVAIFASVYTVWASVWGLFFRKFFWDFVAGTLQPGPTNSNGLPCADANPCGIVPAKGDQIFISLIVNAPIIQIIALVFGITHLFLELTPQIRHMSIYRSFPLRIVTYTLQAFFAVLFYQGTNGAIYTTTAVVGFIVAQIKGEIMVDVLEERAKAARGGAGGRVGDSKV